MKDALDGLLRRLGSIRNMMRDRVRGSVANFPLLSFAGVFLAGIVAWGGFNWSLEMTNTEEFCISCHVMKNNVYREYKTTIHYSNRTGVRATCPDCHVPREWVHKVVRKVKATNELYHWLKGSIDTEEKFKAKRPVLAGHVWDSMKATDSRECRNCHNEISMRKGAQNDKASMLHVLGTDLKLTCIDCHKGIAHSLPDNFNKNELFDELHERFKTQKIDCKQCHQDMAGLNRSNGWDD